MINMNMLTMAQQYCLLQNELMEDTGVLTGGSLVDSYTSPLHCHWKITTEDVHAVIIIVNFEYLNLRTVY